MITCSYEYKYCLSLPLLYHTYTYIYTYTYTHTYTYSYTYTYNLDCLPVALYATHTYNFCIYKLSNILHLSDLRGTHLSDGCLYCRRTSKY
jgi:hypothetical protein